MYEYSYQERHMGTDVALSFVCKEVEVAEAIATKTFASIHDYEMRFSRFLPESELSRLNRGGAVQVSQEFIMILEKSIELHNLTKGAFNPLVQVQQLGYTKSFANLGDSVINLPSYVYDTDIQNIKIDHDTKTVTLGLNQMLDFGGVLKGYLATQLADSVMKEYVDCHGCIVNIGGDLATRGLDCLHEPFIFELYNPVTGEEVATVLTDTSLATSGTYARTWQTNIGQRHHIVDVASQDNPIQSLVTASIIHHDGSVAEALTKLFLTKGIETALNVVPPQVVDYKYFVVSATGSVSTNIV